MNILVDEVLENGVHKWSGTSNDKTWTLYCGDAEEALRNIPDGSVHCIVTSPPYYSLRDYGVDGQIGLEDTVNESTCLHLLVDSMYSFPRSGRLSPVDN